MQKKITVSLPPPLDARLNARSLMLVSEIEINKLSFSFHTISTIGFFCDYWATLLKKSGVRMYSWDYLDLIDNESYIIDKYLDLDFFFHVLTRRKRLLKLVSLRLVLNNKSVKVARTSNLKLDRIRVLLNASGFIYNCMWVCVWINSIIAFNIYIWRPFCGQFREIPWYPWSA